MYILYTIFSPAMPEIARLFLCFFRVLFLFFCFCVCVVVVGGGGGGVIQYTLIFSLYVPIIFNCPSKLFMFSAPPPPPQHTPSFFLSFFIKLFIVVFLA